MSEKKTFIKVENMSFAYTEGVDSLPIPALNNLNFEIKKGEYVAILGHNGSGKSTLAKLLSMILIPSKGDIYIDGILTSSPNITDDEIFEVRKKIGMVFQNPDNQLVATVVEEDVAFGPENLGIPREEMIIRVNEALQMVGMSEYRKHAPHKLSGGQKQRVAIAGIIAMLPGCIILDESTAMLDPVGRKDVIDIIEKLNKELGITIINITHYMDEAARAERVIVINNGSIIFDDTPRAVFSNVDSLHEIGLDVPQGVELVNALSSMGLNISTDVLTPDECVESIFKAISEITDK